MRGLTVAPLAALLFASALRAEAEASAVATGGAPAGDSVAAVAAGVLGGRVVGSESPLHAASVYVYHLADSQLQKALTDSDGGFGFAELPAGLYKVVAFKPGFLPAVVLLTRAAANVRQFVDLELEREPVPGAVAADDFWSLRGEVPADVLRDIEIALFADPAVDADAGHKVALGPTDDGRFHAAMRAETGVAALVDGTARLTAGRIAVEGQVAGMAIGLSGDYRQLHAAAGGRPLATEVGASRGMRLELATSDQTRVDVRTLSNTMAEGVAGPRGADFEHVQVSWSQRVGERGRSELAARYTAENNFYRQGWMDLVGVPNSSRTWSVDGAYTARLDERSSLQTGFHYRLREEELAAGPRLFLAGAGLPTETLDLFARGGTQVQPALLVEYGLYATQVDGTVSLMPRGGFVMQLTDGWQLGGSFGQRVALDTETRRGDFYPTLWDDSAVCELGEDACYRLFVARGEEQSVERMSFGVAHRRFADTLRVYFNEDVFNHLESLYLVQGDELSELQLALTQELGSQVVATFAANLGTGGGGELAGRDKRTYRNQVRYLVTSLDAHFARTETGVFLAFHRLEQALRPVAGSATTTASSTVAIERLQVRLSQNLDVLLDLPAVWALRLNMELARGGLLDTAPDRDGVRRQLTGGVAVSF
jgi:hypothetical protein